MSSDLCLASRPPVDSLSIAQISQEYPPRGWEDVFAKASLELKLVSQKVAELGPFFPKKEDLFKAFDLCPLDRVKVVILGQDPYHATYNGHPQANGMAFSTNKGTPIQPSMANIYKELKREYPDYKIPNHADLSYWAEQGVLLLNTSLTVKPHEAGSHGEIWNGVITRVIDGISITNPTCIYLLWGARAREFSHQLSPRAIKLFASHPSPFSVNKGSRNIPAFLGCDHFKMTNQYLAEQGQILIDWQIQ